MAKIVNIKESALIAKIEEMAKKELADRKKQYLNENKVKTTLKEGKSPKKVKVTESDLVDKIQSVVESVVEKEFNQWKKTQK